MDSPLSRYRNLTVLVIVILSQLVLLAWQVKSNQDVRILRVWAVTLVTPLARAVEGVRSWAVHSIEGYWSLSSAQSENRRLMEELGRLKLENQYLKAELSTAQRAEALTAFQKRSPSKMVAARVIGTSTGTNSKVVFVDRGSTSGVLRGMAVLTPDGIVGKVLASYPTASQVQLITDPTFAAGVISGKNRVTGTLKGQGRSDCIVDYIQIEQKVDVGEWFYTSGDDRVFPKGLPVGPVTVVRQGRTLKEIYLAPSGFRNGLEEVLVVIEGVHQQLPEDQSTGSDSMKLLPPPPAEKTSQSAAPTSDDGPASTEADRLRRKYQGIGEAQKHAYGEGMTSPNFNRPPPSPSDAPKPATPTKPTTSPAATPSVSVPASGTPPQSAPAGEKKNEASSTPTRPEQVKPAAQPPATVAPVPPRVAPADEKKREVPPPTAQPGAAKPTAQPPAAVPPVPPRVAPTDEKKREGPPPAAQPGTAKPGAQTPAPVAPQP